MKQLTEHGTGIGAPLWKKAVCLAVLIAIAALLIVGFSKKSCGCTPQVNPYFSCPNQ